MRFLKKLWASLLAAFLIIPMFQQTTAQAATPISIYIDGSRLTTDQAPVVISGRVMLPLRAIFEALDATVNYNQTLQTVTAQKDGTTIVLKLKSRSATINNEAVLLDVPAQSIKGRTMVPVRFVSEALGQQVGWNNSTKIVTINSGSGSGGSDNGGADPNPVAYVSARDVGNNGDGRDLEISFSKSSNESRVEQYRVMIVKSSNASGFNLAAAQRVSSANYTSLSPSGTDPVLNLSAGARDVDGSAIRENQSYVAYVLAIGKGNSADALSNPSPAITLSNGAAVAAPTNVKVSDVSDYGDGRDLNVTFTRAQNESSIANYRVLVVKTKDAGSFTLSTANNVPSSYSTIVSKSGSGSTLTGQLASSARDTSGDLIKNGVSYTVFVQSVSNNSGYANKLSSASSAITLATGSVISPVITKVEDWNDYGDGRDLRVSFNRISDETRIGSYRIFVVKASDYANFSLAKANAVSSVNYTQVNKTGSNITSYALSSSARDVDGATIRNGVSYRVFVMAVGTGNYAGTNTLSAASSAITLTKGNTVDTVSNVTVEDVSDYNDGRDLRVTFTRASNETYISNYRIMVVKTSDAGNFTLSKANNVGSANYTTVSKNGYTLSTVLNAGARDVDGATIRNGVSYRVFVLSVASSGYNLSNALSYYSSPITLSTNAVGAVSNLNVADVSDYGDGRDLWVSFNRAADESNISHYRIMVVKSANAGSFNLSKANAVPSDRYTYISKGNYTLTGTLAAGAKDVDGAAIRSGVSYQVFVLSYGSGGYSGSNALSYASNVITLSGTAVGTASNVTANDVNDFGDGRDLRVTFTRASNETYISQYRVFVVKASKFGSFDLNAANSNPYYTAVNKNGVTLTVDLGAGARDTDGEFLRNGVAYRVYVLSMAASGGGSNALSGVSNEVMLNNNRAFEQLNVTAQATGGGYSYSDVVVSFNKQPNESNVQEYRIMVVPAANVSSFNLDYANKVTLDSNFTTVSPNGQNIQVPLNRANTVYGTPLDVNTTYHVFVLTVAKSGSGMQNVLSGPSGQVKLNVDPSTVPVPAATIVSATANGTNIDVSINKPDGDQNIKQYLVIAVPDTDVPSIIASGGYQGASVPKQGPYSSTLNRDYQGNEINFQSKSYSIFVITVPDTSKSTNYNITGPTSVTP
ncbi:copper amine oxidase N-terminal domain-containing protein [uncultured Paenibacillus sp.]|uniref:copper amine oxidase N-terminal domain-containing protein n=1 Tax=uncultured Paenibacillus sp. TaxID=227322 RepID=UPI0028054971|nr:copper amine oxidase N-terminal domain-containing protein [uncultured Paenibacillus sp.]